MNKFNALLKDIWESYRPVDMANVHIDDQHKLAYLYARENPLECGEPWATKPVKTQYDDTHYWHRFILALEDGDAVLAQYIARAALVNQIEVYVDQQLAVLRQETEDREFHSSVEEV